VVLTVPTVLSELSELTNTSSESIIPKEWTENLRAKFH